MRRRAFISLLGGAAAAWPLKVRAQQANSATIGLLWPGDAPPASPRMESFRQGLRALGFVARTLPSSCATLKEAPNSFPSSPPS